MAGRSNKTREVSLSDRLRGNGAAYRRNNDALPGSTTVTLCPFHTRCHFWRGLHRQINAYFYKRATSDGDKLALTM